MKAERHQCSQRVYHPHTFMGSPCSVNAKYFEGNEWYCHNHAPSKKQEKRDKERAAWAEERARDERIKERATARQLAILRELNGSNVDEKTQLSGWDVTLETRRDPSFHYTGGIVLSYKAIDRLLVKLGIDPQGFFS